MLRAQGGGAALLLVSKDKGSATWGQGGQEEGKKEGLWPRAGVNEETPMAEGSGWKGRLGRLTLLEESRMDRVAL